MIRSAASVDFEEDTAVGQHVWPAVQHSIRLPQVVDDPKTLFFRTGFCFQ